VAQVTSPILVDTHFILWLRVVPRVLTRGERAVLDNAPSRHVSIVSLWEIAIMMTVGRIPPDVHLLETPVGFDLLPVREEHCKAYAALPMHHRDPFDRMLIAQAQSEQVPLLTRDRAITAYAEQATILRYPEP
jgi:PIN domain nuclease of toxin-antitoxin system